MNIWFTSDTHFGHGNIIKYSGRPYLSDRELQLLAEERKGGENLRVSRESVERMDDCLFEEINKVVQEDDELWHLGDFCFAPKYDYFKAAKNYRRRIKCKNVHLIWGNHDNYSLAPLFSSTHHMETVSVGQGKAQQNIVCNHYAMAIWNRSHRGAWHLYGHSHSGAEDWLDAALPGRRSFDVGVDNAAKILGAYRPWSFDEIKQIMDKKTGCVIDHHE